MWMLLWVLLGCMPPTAPPTTGPASPLTSATLTTTAHAFIKEQSSMMARCQHEIADRIAADQLMTQPTPYTQEDVVRSCDAIVQHYLGAKRALRGHNHTVDHALSMAARVSDDLTVLGFTVGQRRTGDTVRSAHDHLTRSLQESLRDLHTHFPTHLVFHTLQPDRARELTPAALNREIGRILQNDKSSFGSLEGLFQRYALDQGTVPPLVRRHALDHYGEALAGRLEHRMHEWAMTTAPGQDGQLEAMHRYHLACQAYVRSYLSLVRRFVDGEVTTVKLLSESAASMSAATTEWHYAYARLRDQNTAR